VKERDAIGARFRAGETLGLTNVDLFGEGYDVPAAEVALMLRPTQSEVLYLQQCGRVLRASPGKKEALILDHAGNAGRFGVPDEDRAWSLEGQGRKKRNAEPEMRIKICDNCFAAQLPGTLVCRHCGHTFKFTPREVQVVEGALEEINVAMVKKNKKRAQAAARTYEQLLALGREWKHSYPEAWARNVLKSRGVAV
jgi:superfamily II DNA or RNA helicase